MNKPQKDIGTSAAKLRTTIVATLGPATSDVGSIENLIREGLDLLTSSGLVNTGDTAVMIAGTSLMPGATDVLKVHHF